MFRDCFEVKLDMESVIIYSFDRMFGIVVIICVGILLKMRDMSIDDNISYYEG